jgi:aryl-alcohol dehydrogenase
MPFGPGAYCESLSAKDFGELRPDGTTALTAEDGSAVSSHIFGHSAFGIYANVVENSIIPFGVRAATRGYRGRRAPDPAMLPIR